MIVKSEKVNLVDSWSSLGFPNISIEKAEKMEDELTLLINHQLDLLVKKKRTFEVGTKKVL
jgi:hypothetical protein